ncbi:MAG TPA: ATP-binding protein, partial [Candidatus Obscuribacterales bacterium]
RQVHDLEQRFGAFECSPYPESPKSAIVTPIALPGVAHLWGVFIAGVSPRRALDEAYQTFYTMLGKSVTTAIATAHAYEEERRRAEALAELDRAKTVFFNNVSHEFRTPLTLMLGPAKDALADQDNPLAPDQRQRIEVMQRNAQRLLKLANTLLDFSRIESDRLQAVYEPTDLASFTAELASVFRSAIEQANLRLVVDCPPLPDPIYVDREMWEKIVLNLLSNAFKFTFSGEITVRLQRVGEQVELSVEDTGIGIPAAEIPRLFQRFHRVKGAERRAFEGSGIGLSLVQELVNLHGGTLQVSSVEGKGSCFRVLIPSGSAHLPAERIGATGSSMVMGSAPYVEEALLWLPEGNLKVPALNSEAQSLSSNIQAQSSKVQSQNSEVQSQNSEIQAQNSEIQAQNSEVQSQNSEIQSQNSEIQAQSSNIHAQSSKHQPLFKTAYILLVDDNADVRKYVKRLLSQRWQVETAANGAIALKLIQQKLPDLVLTDVMMPELDGFGLLKALRADPLTQSIPIILLSARAGEEATIEGLEAGADDYLIKPFSTRELIARVESQLQMSHLRQEQSTNRFKNEFLMTITHELQAPLATILGWARLLQTKSLDPTTTMRALATIERHATIEAKLVKELLDVSSILSGKLHLRSQLVDLSSLVQNVTATFREAAEAKRIQLVETIVTVALGDVVADGDRLRQVIGNLLDNAIKFTPEGGQVNVRLERIGSDVQITVTDTGIGIAADFLPFVFDRFTQAEVPSHHSPGGVGIGLAIARYLVELHNGTIEVASEGEGRGATFAIKIPLVP